jgi:hypothetical protein
MSFKKNPHQQLRLDDAAFSLTEREQRILADSWASRFATDVFPRINEGRFSVLYSDNAFSRPNTPVNVIVGLLIIKELFGYTDDELFETLLFDVRLQWALHTSSFAEQPVSDRTLSRFRERLLFWEQATGQDLMAEEMISLASAFAAFIGMETILKRMDSVMVASSCKTMSRLEIIYTCVANMVRLVDKEYGTDACSGFVRYLDEGDLNDTIYHSKPADAAKDLITVASEGWALLDRWATDLSDRDQYRLLSRCLTEQTVRDEKGEVTPRPGKEIGTDSLQNPSDADATYRMKAGKKHKGYVGNFVEDVGTDAKGRPIALITDFDYAQNTKSDVEFGREAIDAAGLQDKMIPLVADGAYFSTENMACAKKKNIDLVTTAMTAAPPSPIHKDFQIDEAQNTITACPKGHAPLSCVYYEKTDSWRLVFKKSHCKSCPNATTCKVKFQKKGAALHVSRTAILRSRCAARMTEDPYREIARQRNAVEGIPSVLRRRYRVDDMPVRGLANTKLWYTIKIGAINVARVLAHGSKKSPMTPPSTSLTCFSKMIRHICTPGDIMRSISANVMGAINLVPTCC